MEAAFDPVSEHEENYLEMVLDRGRRRGLEESGTLTAPLADLSLRPAITIPPETSLRGAVRRMKEAGIGSVLIEDGGRLTGIFTERDLLMRVVDEGLDLDRTPVAEVMSREPQTLRLSDAVSFAINMMSEGGLRHVPVTDQGGRPRHVVSVRDLARWLADCHPERVRNLPPEPGFASSRHGG
ncbi:MAG: CBS domain-containing protein [Planctomycetes bacterium]|nr:CBS domain-containing protein [Planctomycetota bacterium]